MQNNTASTSLNDERRLGWFWSYDEIFDLDISEHAKLIYLNLCRRAKKSGRSFPSHSRIAKDCSVSIPTVKRAIKELIEVAAIRFTSRKVIGKPNTYNINDISQWKTGGRSQRATQVGLTDLPGRSLRSTKENELRNKKIKEAPLLDTMEDINNYSNVYTLSDIDGKGNIDKELFEILREGIYRNDIFSMYDNLINKISLEDLVGESAYKALKSVFMNSENMLRRVFDITYSTIDQSQIVGDVKRMFPYDKMPSDCYKRRDFFVAAVANTVTAALIKSLFYHVMRLN